MHCLELEDIRKDIRSRLWFSYRKGFKAIGDTGISSDKGWGCMLRCGQMVIAQALLFLHLGECFSSSVIHYCNFVNGYF